MPKSRLFSCYQACQRYWRGCIAAEIDLFGRYFDHIIQFAPQPGDYGELFEQMEAPAKTVATDIDELRVALDRPAARRLVILNANLNFDLDVQETLSRVRALLRRSDRIAVIGYNPYYRWWFSFSHWWQLRKSTVPTTMLTKVHLSHLCRLARLEVVWQRHTVFSPGALAGIGNLITRLLPALPFLRHLGSVGIYLLRPTDYDRSLSRPSLSIVVPARNEKGNIQAIVERIPLIEGVKTEVIFVEGHSKDDTWAEIQRVAAASSRGFEIRTLQQQGIGKADAVRQAFSLARNELLVILDADLSVPPELLERFYMAYVDGHGDFINGNRLLYPYEGEAMGFLNWLGNLFFAKALTAVLRVPLGDTLCGTKLLRRDDYERMVRWRNDFGDRDPFGDFELLYPAAIFGLGIVDIPIHYKARTYGSTNISRFRHGWQLLKMTWVAWRCIALGRIPSDMKRRRV